MSADFYAQRPALYNKIYEITREHNESVLNGVMNNEYMFEFYLRCGGINSASREEAISNISRAATILVYFVDLNLYSVYSREPTVVSEGRDADLDTVFGKIRIDCMLTNQSSPKSTLILLTVNPDTFRDVYNKVSRSLRLPPASRSVAAICAKSIECLLNEIIAEPTLMLICNENEQNERNEYTNCRAKFTRILHASIAPAVYFIAEEPFCGRIKIGYSKTPKKRLGQLQTGNATRLTIHGLIYTLELAELEKRLHARLAAKRIAGEWYAISKAEVDALIDELQ